MSVYVIAEVDVTNEDWIPEYAEKVHHIVEKHGGRYLSRSGNITQLEGESQPTTMIALLEFPDADAVVAFATDPDYAPFGKARQEGSNSRFRMIDDTDLAGTIPYLDKG